MKKKKLTIVFLVIIVVATSTITITKTKAINEPIVECEIFFTNEGFYTGENITESFQIYTDTRLRLFLENGFNHTLKIWLPCFEQEGITRGKNITLYSYVSSREPYYLQEEVICRTPGKFPITCDLLEDQYTIEVIRFRSATLITSPLIWVLIGFVLLLIFGLLGTFLEIVEKKVKISEGEKKIAEYEKDNILIFGSPTVDSASSEIADAIAKTRQIQSLPQDVNDILEMFDDTVFTFKLLEQKGDINAIELGLAIKQYLSANTYLHALVGRLTSKNRTLKARLGNVEDERDSLDEVLVVGDGALAIDNRLINMDSQEESFMKKYGNFVWMFIFLLIVIAIVFFGIYIMNQIPSYEGF